MSLSQPRAFFGIHSFSPYSPSTREFYGTVKCIGASSLNLTGEVVELRGGSNRFAWAAEDGAINAELSIKPKSYESFLFTLFLGKAPTDNSADTAGAASTLTNAYGSTCKSATIGIASVAVVAANKADLKFSKYVVKVVSATTVDVFAGSDADFARGTDGDFTTDLLKIAAAQAIATGADTNITGFGFKFVGGSGTIGMTVGDTAYFEIKPPSSKSMEVTVGGLTDVFPEFGAIMVAQRRGNQEMMELDVFKAKGIGLPLAFDEKKWSEADIKAKCYYDATRSGVFSVRHITLND